MIVPIIFREDSEGAILALFPTVVADMGPPVMAEYYGPIFYDPKYSRSRYTYGAYSQFRTIETTKPVKPWHEDQRCWEIMRDVRRDYVEHTEGLDIEDGSDVQFKVYQRHTKQLRDELMDKVRRMRGKP